MQAACCRFSLRNRSRPGMSTRKEGCAKAPARKIVLFIKKINSIKYNYYNVKLYFTFISRSLSHTWWKGRGLHPAKGEANLWMRLFAMQLPHMQKLYCWLGNLPSPWGVWVRMGEWFHTKPTQHPSDPLYTVDHEKLKKITKTFKIKKNILIVLQV